jgi:hypothetical protein
LYHRYFKQLKDCIVYKYKAGYIRYYLCEFVGVWMCGCVELKGMMVI